MAKAEQKVEQDVIEDIYSKLTNLEGEIARLKKELDGAVSLMTEQAEAVSRSSSGKVIPKVDGLIRTPQIGQTVWWFQSANSNSPPFAAKVLGINGPGDVQLEVFIFGNPNTSMRYKKKVLHVDNPEHVKQSPMTQLNGGWDYRPGDVNEDCYACHRERIALRERVAKDTRVNG